MTAESPPVFLASYRGGSRGIARIIGAVVRWCTHSEWSHCEIAIGDAIMGPALCVSSSGLDGGVRGKMMQLDPARWELTPLPDVRAETVLDVLAEHDGAPYDWLGALRFGLPVVLRGEHPRRWFCSELCALIIGLDDPWRFTPADLKAVAQRLGSGECRRTQQMRFSLRLTKSDDGCWEDVREHPLGAER